MGLDLRGIELLHIPHRLTQPDGPDEVGRSGLELQRHGGIGRAGEGHAVDHVAAPEERGHGIEQRPLAVQHADAGRTVELVAREGIEVAVERLHVHAAVHHPLAAVDDDDRPDGMGRADDGPQVGPRAERIGGLRHSDHARACVEQRFEQVGAQRPLVVEGQHAQLGPLALGEQLPRHEVRVVFHLADDDVVARMHEALAPGVGHRVERRRGPGREDHLLLRRGAQEGGNPLAGRLVARRGLLREQVHAAVDVGIQLAVQPVDGLDHRQGLLRRGSVVEVDQRPPVDFACEDRKHPTYLFNVQHRHIRSIFAATASSSTSPNGSTPQRRTMSPTNPSICSRRASVSLRPRCRM